MTTTLHPSEIQFTCPPWCKVSREEHLEGLGNHGGRCIHWSEDREGERWAVAITSYTYPDGTPADDEEVQLEVAAEPSTILSRMEACKLVKAILAALQEADPTLA